MPPPLVYARRWAPVALSVSCNVAPEMPSVVPYLSSAPLSARVVSAGFPPLPEPVEQELATPSPHKNESHQPSPLPERSTSASSAQLKDRTSSARSVSQVSCAAAANVSPVHAATWSAAAWHW